MSWDDEASVVGAQSGYDEADVGIQSGDDEGPQIGEGAWVEGVWHDPIDPHPFAPRESHLRLEFHLDYNLNPIQVMTKCD
jgi:hypothetical protein